MRPPGLDSTRKGRSNTNTAARHASGPGGPPQGRGPLPCRTHDTPDHRVGCGSPGPALLGWWQKVSEKDLKLHSWPYLMRHLPHLNAKGNQP